jgi:arsenite-transporting ATPase
MPDNPISRVFSTLRQVMYGMASHDMSRYAMRTRASMEHLFILITMGDLLQPSPAALRGPPDQHLEAPHAARARHHGRARLVVPSLLSQQIATRPYVMFGGKGGLGKTTFSAATGYWLAQQGKKVLVFSVDPQASLSDIFQQDIFGKGPVKIMDNLWAQEIDADSHIRAYQQEIRQKILDLYGFSEVPEEVENYIQAASAEPAMEESAIFDAVVDIVVGGSYDYYIYDLVPLGHALYYLSMAKVYDEWINKITRLRQEMAEYEQVASVMKRQKTTEEDLILGELLYIKGRINASSSILTDRQKTAFFFVLVPEEMILFDTRKAAELFAKFDVPIVGYVVNRVLPSDLAQQNVPEYLKHRIEMQKRYLSQIETTFGNQVLAQVPELERDVTGLPAIERLARIMYM